MNERNYVMEGVGISMILYLGVLSIQDIKRKKISIPCLVVGMVLVIASILFVRDITMLQRFIGGAIGGIMFLVSLCTHEAIGKADCCLILYLGFMFGGLHTLVMLMVSLISCCIFCIIGLSLRFIKRRQSIPFIPFLLIGVIFMLCILYREL